MRSTVLNPDARPPKAAPKLPPSLFPPNLCFMVKRKENALGAFVTARSDRKFELGVFCSDQILELREEEMLLVPLFFLILLLEQVA
jgi:hypothetical protein